MRKILYPGTFDPIHNGHIDIASRAAELFDELEFVVAVNPEKDTLFSLRKRVKLIKESVIGKANIKVNFFRGLVVDYASSNGFSAIIRGLRAVADFEYEFQLATMNRSLAPDIESIFFTPKDTLIYVSSSLVKEIATFGGDVSRFVPPNVKAALLKKITG